MPVYVRDAGIWKVANVFVRDGGAWKPAALSVRDGGVWKATVNIEVSINPPAQGASDSFSSHIFYCSVSVNGGTASAYSWGLTNNYGGSWTVNTGQGTAFASARVTLVPVEGDAEAIFYCDVTVNGRIYRAQCMLTYYRYL